MSAIYLAPGNRTRVGLGFVAAIAALSAFVTIPAAAFSQSVKIPGNIAPQALTSSTVGQADPARVLNLSIQFKPRNRNQIDALLAAQQDPTSPQYRKWLTPEEYTRRFGPTPADFEAVAGWLTSSGFKISGGSPADGFIRFTGTVATAERAFNTKIMLFGDGSKFANTTEPEVPGAIADRIGEVLGLQNLGRIEPVYKAGGAHGLPVKRPTARPTSKRDSGSEPAWAWSTLGGTGNTFAPADFYTFYDENTLLSSGIDGNSPGDCIAIFADGNIFDDILNIFTSDPTDLDFSLAPISLTTVLAEGSDPGVLAGIDGEAYLDIEWSHSVAPGAPIILYVADPNHFTYEQNLQDTIGAAVNQNKCGAINISYTDCGQPSTFYTGTLGPIFAKAALQGQSVFVSSGDRGVDNCNLGVPNVNELSANPNITSVGGTGFDPNYDASGNDVGFVAEFVWNDNDLSTAGENTAGGGGASAAFLTKPPYQKGPGVPSDGKRDVPDVAMIASGEHPGVLIVQDDDSGAAPADTPIASQIGGTSLAAPVWAGISRLIQQKIGKRPGPLNPLIYQLAGAPAGEAAAGFRDVLTGNNTFINSSKKTVTGYSAGPGFDLATGWGTVDVTKFVDAYAAAALASPTSTATPTASPTPTRTATPTVTATRTATPTATPTPGGVLKYSAGVLKFGKVKVGATSKPKNLILTNISKRGSPTVTLESGQFSPGFGYFKTLTTCFSPIDVLNPKQKCKIAVGFAPTRPGALTGSLVIHDNSKKGPSQTIILKGTGH